MPDTVKFVGHDAKVVIADIQEQNDWEVTDEFGLNAAFVRCNVNRESDVSDTCQFCCVEVWMPRHHVQQCRCGMQDFPQYRGPRPWRFDHVMSMNIRGVVAEIKDIARVMIPCGSGSILCTASITGMLRGLAQHTYSISKSAIIGVVRSAAAKLCIHGIRINCISPFALPTMFVMEELRLMYSVDNQHLMEIVHNSGVLQGVNCKTSDIADAALYLVSDNAKYVNGHKNLQ